MRKLYIMLALLCTCFCAFYTYETNVKKSIRDSVLRLHVVANSNSQKDQELKIAVRDFLLTEFEKMSNSASSKEEAMLNAGKNLKLLQREAEKKVKELGFSYDVNVILGESVFPRKEYENITLPAGRYDSLRVNIGKAEGENWWCVLYPALCFSESVKGKAEELSLLEKSLSSEEFKIITETERGKTQIKLKILELF